MKPIILFTILLALTLLSCQKKDSLTEFRENTDIRKTLYFEPSTLRMVNLQNNPEFNQLVKEIQNATYFMVDQNEHSDSAVHRLKEAVIKEGYEEMLAVKDKNADVIVYALEEKTPIILAVARTDTTYHIVEMQGMVNLMKIPNLLEKLNDNAFLNVLNLTEKKKPKPHIESDTTNQKPE